MISTKKTKNYISGSARQVDFESGDSVINLDLKLEDLNNLPVSEKGYIRLVVAKRKSVGNYGETHSVYENDFVPDKTKSAKGATAPKGPSVSAPRSKAPF